MLRPIYVGASLPAMGRRMRSLLSAADRGSAALDALPLLPELEFDMGDDLTQVEAPDELIEGVLTRGALSALYGDSNTGKTFLALDLAAAVARGASWMGRRTEGGLVLYLATEGPRSVRARALAYQRANDVQLRLLAIVKSPIDLFDGKADSTAVIALVTKLEAAYSQRVELIVGDTLSRLSAGANENSGEDMSIVVRNIDRIRTATGAHFLLIHHTGKEAARGMRGWSGMRAAIDTEIEVTADEATGERAAEITKQRDLAGKGTRIGFRLHVVQLGIGKWSAPITSCVVEPTDAPEKPKRGRRVSEIAGAITEMLTTKGGGVRKADVAKHFEGRYERGPVYREMKKLATAGVLLDVAGSVRMAVMP